MSNSTEQSIKSKLKNISKAENRPFQEVWSDFFIERLLARIAVSPFSKNLIFKGGMCLKQYVEINRSTMDIDFLVKNLKSDQENLKKCFEEIISQNLNDSIYFDNLKFELLINNPGFRISVMAHLGQSRFPLKIDLGVGDIVKPKKMTLSLLSTTKGTLFEKEINLWAYAPEQLFL